MADTKITALTAITTVDPAVDVLPIVDVSDTTMAASGTTKKITTNQLLGSGGTATLASATITGNLTVDTNTFFVDSTNNGVGIGTATPTSYGAGYSVLEVAGSTTGVINVKGGSTVYGQVSTEPNILKIDALGASSVLKVLTNSVERYRIDNTGISTWYVGGSTAMTLNSTGLGVGVIPSGNNQLSVRSSGSGTEMTVSLGRTSQEGLIGISSGTNGFVTGSVAGDMVVRSNGKLMLFNNSANSGITIDSSGNVGVGVTPSAWQVTYKAIDINAVTSIWGSSSISIVSNNTWYDGSLRYKTAATASYLQQGSKRFEFWQSSDATPVAGGVAAFTQAMTLDASGNLLVGTTSGTSHNLRKQGATVEGDTHLNVGNAEHLFFACSSVTYNAAAAAYKITRNSSTLRSINAGGTINASGADYAEYMVKCGDFVLAKGDVAGIDANGKLTNVFADAISFVVKSTDPSYVGNDKWGVDLEGDALETARQLVDRIAFAGQVPVNVTGAKAGDYIVPVANGTGIKGQAVSNPTFEQYQLAVGKVISIDADGRARIIVKVA